MAKKKTSKKATKKSPAKKVTKQATKKSAKKSPAKKTAKKTTKKTSAKKSTESSAFASTMEDSQPEFYSSPSSSSAMDSYSAGAGMSDVSRPEDVGDGAGSRKIAILAVVIILAIITLVVLGKDTLFGTKKGPVVDDKAKVEAKNDTPPDANKVEDKVEDKKDQTADAKKDETAPADYNIHVLKEGEVLWNLAKKYLGNGNRYPEILKLNGVTLAQWKTNMKPGTEVKIPKK